MRTIALVLCPYCRERFNRDTTPHVQISAKRWAHTTCAQRAAADRAKEEQDKENLDKYIMQLFKIDYIDARIRKQIKTYVDEYHFSYSGIMLTLKFFFEVKKNDISKSNGGIGIVPYVYKQAEEYYYSLWLAKQTNEDKDIEDFKPVEHIVKIISPEREKMRPRSLFTFLDEEDI